MRFLKATRSILDLRFLQIFELRNTKDKEIFMNHGAEKPDTLKTKHNQNFKLCLETCKLVLSF